MPEYYILKKSLFCNNESEQEEVRNYNIFCVIDTIMNAHTCTHTYTYIHTYIVYIYNIYLISYFVYKGYYMSEEQTYDFKW